MGGNRLLGARNPGKHWEGTVWHVRWTQPGEPGARTARGDSGGGDGKGRPHAERRSENPLRGSRGFGARAPSGRQGRTGGRAGGGAGPGTSAGRLSMAGGTIGRARERQGEETSGAKDEGMHRFWDPDAIVPEHSHPHEQMGMMSTASRSQKERSTPAITR
jgi:hypothetical protein